MISLFPNNITPGVTPPADRIAAVINGSLVPQLRKDFSALREMQESWLYNDLPDLIAAAVDEQTTLAGYSPEFWQEIGAVFLSLTAWMDTPIAALGNKTPRAVLGRDYIQEQSA